MILESLQRAPKTNLELLKCTTIKPEVLHLALNSLSAKSLILLKERTYKINPVLSKQMKALLKEQENIKQEVTEIISTCFDLACNGESDFKLKKVYLNKEDLLVYKGLKHQLETFLNSINNDKEETNNQTCIFWGEGNYGKIINHYIHH